MKRIWAWPTCKHKNLRGIYGDEIIFAANWKRTQCTDCHRYLDLPLSAVTEKGPQR